VAHGEQWELITLVQGRAALLLFAPQRRLAQRIDLGAGAARAVEVPPGAVHAAVVLERGTLLLEIKPGPYRPNDFVDWAPAEGAPAAEPFVAWAGRAAPGDAVPGS
jgi:cupin fold WbuC family metalloprotein